MISHDRTYFSAVSENLFADLFDGFSLIPYVSLETTITTIPDVGNVWNLILESIMIFVAPKEIDRNFK